MNDSWRRRKADANLTEVTFEASTGKVKKLPRLVSLAEAIRTVVSHQTATGTYPPNVNNVSNSENACKGAGSECSDIAVVILIGQEKIHLKRCVEKLAPLNPRQIFLVESQPDDGGVAIAKETAAKLGLRLETMYHKWPGTQAVQFNWALDEIGVDGRCRCTEEVSGSKFQVSGGDVGWVLRLDADEYLTEETCERLCGPQGLRALPDEVAGLTLELKRIIFGGEIRHATNGIRQVRIFRRGKARYAETLMDERLIVEGKVMDFDGAFYDDNLNGLEWWKNKHRGYAKREAEQAIAGTFQDPRKASYYKLPRYLRAVMYFCIRYFLKGGFLDGKAGWRWNFWQGLWYRWMVDREIGRIRCRS